MFSVFRDDLDYEEVDDKCKSTSLSVDPAAQLKSDSVSKGHLPKLDSSETLLWNASSSQINFETMCNTRNKEYPSSFKDPEYACDNQNFQLKSQTHEPNFHYGRKCKSSSASYHQIFDYRKQISYISDCCVSDVLKEKAKIKSLSQSHKGSTEKFIAYIDNLELQHIELDKLVSSVNTQITQSAQITQSTIQNDYISAKTISNLQRESMLFKQFNPAYAYRQKILNEIDENQVVIIRADISYGLNVAVPLFLSTTYQNHDLIACESNEILSHVLKEKINFMFSDQNLESNDTQLLVLSEDQLLNRFLYSTLFAGRSSCVIFNIPLKRSIKADIIMMYLKDLLTSQKNSKLILLISPCDEVTNFVDYFSVDINSVSYLDLPNISLPLKVVWRNALVSPSDDFEDDVVKTVFSIHAVCEPGDVIVFLPSSEDIHSVFHKIELEIERRRYNNLSVICIDEGNFTKYMIPEMRIFKRQVFLMPNKCEGLIIPSACYVIDTGIQKEYNYDVKLGINVIVPTFISQARSRIRKNLASMHNLGICFRLYSKVNYVKNMNCREKPEILCLNPLQTLVKIFQDCPHKTQSLQFVEWLPDSVLQDNLKLLKACGAIDENSHLTPFGVNIGKLSLPVKYSRLILRSLHFGLAYEAIILVAFFSANVEIFVESTNDDQQKLIDLKKMDFYHLNSDTFTYLNVYRQWEENRFKMSWCSDNYISYAALKTIRHKINDLVHLVQENLKEEIVQQFSETSDQYDIVNLLFDCFQDNLCVYTGHPRTGYKMLSSGKLALIHPSSFLSQKSDYPEIIIYEDFKLSNQNYYLINLTSIPFDFVMDFLQKGILNFSSSDLFDNKLVERVIENIGEKIIRRFLLKNNGKKIKEMENDVKKETNARVVILEPVLEKGCVKVFAYPENIDFCIVSVKDILDKYVQSITNEEEIKIIEFNKGKNIVTFEIKWTKGAETISAQHVQINCPSQSSAASAAENFSEAPQTSSISYSLKVSWLRRFCSGEGFINLKKKSDFRQAKKLASKIIRVGEFEVFVKRSAANQLQILEIPPEVTEEDLINRFSELLPGCEFEIKLSDLPSFETSSDELLSMKKQLEKNCDDFTNITSFEVTIIKPEPSAKFMEAYVYVFEERCLDIEAKNLSITKVDSMKLSCEPFYFSDLQCSTDVFNALKYRLNEEIEIFSERIKPSGKKYFVKVNLHKEIVNIRLSSNDIDVMKLLQVQLIQLLDGIKLDKTNIRDIHKLFCHGGLIFLKTLGETERVFIMENFEAKNIRLFGLQENCNYVRQHISNFLQDAENETVKNILLSSEKQGRVIVKDMITQYGANLEKFIEMCGLRSAALNIKTSCLSLYGKKESIEKAEECIRKLSETSGSSDVCSSLSPEETCPVCYCPTESLSLRLQQCGHLYCPGCIRGLIAQGHFPLQCCAENCSKVVILEDIKFVLDDDSAKIVELADKSFKAYLEKNRDKIYYCPAADCSMFVYKNEIRDIKWTCPLCRNNICTKCNVIYHEGFSCDMYQGSKADPDYSFKVWQKGTVWCKRCPNCNTAIEKNGGCNNMYCISCRTHFTWN